MALDPDCSLDALDWQLIAALQEDARLSYAELGRRLSLSPPAIAERVRRLEDGGIIVGYSATISPQAIGLTLRVLIDLTTTPDHYPKVKAFMKQCAAIQSAYHVTGQASFRIEALLPSIHELEGLVEQLSPYGSTTTSIVLSTAVQKTRLRPPDGAESG